MKTGNIVTGAQFSTFWPLWKKQWFLHC